MLLGSEGILGVITEAWVRVQDRPATRRRPASRFADFAAGAEAVRALSQSGLYPSNCRLLDPSEAALTGASRATVALLVLGFESADHPVDALDGPRAGAVPRPRRRGSSAGRARGESATDDAVGDAGGQAFLRAPYLRDLFVACGRDQRDVRDGDHLGPLRRSSTAAVMDGDRARGAARSAAAGG